MTPRKEHVLSALHERRNFAPSFVMQESDVLEMAKSAITASFPEFQNSRVELLDQGFDFRVFHVGTQWLFRVPKHTSGTKKLKKELRLLGELGKRLPLSVPNYEYSEESGESPFRSFAGYKKIPGIPADVSETVSPKVVARQLGPFLHSEVTPLLWTVYGFRIKPHLSASIHS